MQQVGCHYCHQTLLAAQRPHPRSSSLGDVAFKEPGVHQQHLRVHNFIATAFVVVGGATAACHPHEHQQRRSVDFGLFIQSNVSPLALCKAEDVAPI